MSESQNNEVQEQTEAEKLAELYEYSDAEIITQQESLSIHEDALDEISVYISDLIKANLPEDRVPQGRANSAVYVDSHLSEETTEETKYIINKLTQLQAAEKTLIRYKRREIQAEQVVSDISKELANLFSALSEG